MSFKLFFLLSFVSSFAAHCAAQASAFEAGVFGEDRRQVINSGQAPWRWIGRILRDGVPVCTAFVIGPRLVMTASHCIKRAEGQLRGSYIFSADMGGNRLKGQNFRPYLADWVSWSDHKHVPGQWYYSDDFALLRLKESLPEDFGYFNLAENLPSIETTKFISAGYPDHLGRMVHKSVDPSCTIHKASAYQLFHDCGITRGNSGGPIFYKNESGGYTAVGVVSTQYVYNIEGEIHAVYGEAFSLEKANVASSIPEGFAWIKSAVTDLLSRP